MSEYSSIQIEKNTTHPEWNGKWLVTFTFDTSSEYTVAEEHFPPGVTPEPKKEPAPDRKIEKVFLKGSFQFYKREETESYTAFGDNSGIPTYDAYSYRKGMFGTGVDVTAGKELTYEMNPVSESVYTLTLPLPSGIYGYSFSILYTDGTMDKTIYDPENMPLKNGGHTIGQSEFDLGDPDRERVPLRYELKQPGTSCGTLRFESYTAIDGTTQPLGIWLPEGYTPDRTYRTIYVSHGGGGNEVDWMISGRLPVIMQNLIRAGETEEAILITMDNTWFNWDETRTLPNVLECIIPYVESHYSVLPGYENRAFCGLSMGSMTTNNMMKIYPGEFGYYGGFSGGIQDLDPAHYQPEVLRTRKIYETCGCVDIAYNNSRGISTLDYLKVLDTLEVPYTFELLDGSHDWGVWRESFIRFAEKILWK